MNFMVLEEIIRSSDPVDDVISRTRDYLRTLGFHDKDGQGPLAMQRGSKWGTLTTMKPRKLKTIVTVNPVETGYAVRYDVDTTGQYVNDSQRQYWGKEKNSIDAVVAGEEPESLEAEEANVTSDAKRLVWSILGYAVLGGLVGVVIVVLLGLFNAGFRGAALPGVGAGAGAAFGARRASKKPNAD